MHLQRPVIVAMVAVRMMQMAIDQVVDVIAVRDLRMAAVWAMHVAYRVAVAAVIWRTRNRIEGRHREDAFVHMIVMHVMQMTIVQIVDVPIVVNRQVAASRSVRMLVVGDFCAGRHGFLLRDDVVVHACSAL